MSKLLRFDLAAIGGGFAGLCAALRGAELGLRTAVIEAGADDNYLCSSRWAGGIFHVSYHDVKLGRDALLEEINRQTSGEAAPELAAAIADDAGRTVIGWRARARSLPKAARSTGTASRWRRRARRSPARIGDAAAPIA